jgi:hypothetical protein
MTEIFRNSQLVNDRRFKDHSINMSASASRPTWKSRHENDGLTKYGGRDLMGYAQKTPNPKWPKGAKVALNFVVNYEEGGEKCLLHGDGESEKLLSEISGCAGLGTYAQCLILLQFDQQCPTYLNLPFFAYRGRETR